MADDRESDKVANNQQQVEQSTDKAIDEVASSSSDFNKHLHEQAMDQANPNRAPKSTTHALGRPEIIGDDGQLLVKGARPAEGQTLSKDAPAIDFWNERRPEDVAFDKRMQVNERAKQILEDVYRGGDIQEHLKKIEDPEERKAIIERMKVLNEKSQGLAKWAGIEIPRIDFHEDGTVLVPGYKPVDRNNIQYYEPGLNHGIPKSDSIQHLTQLMDHLNDEDRKAALLSQGIRLGGMKEAEDFKKPGFGELGSGLDEIDLSQPLWKLKEDEDRRRQNDEFWEKIRKENPFWGINSGEGPYLKDQ